jgi:hypothetical protein
VLTPFQQLTLNIYATPKMLYMKNRDGNSDYDEDVATDYDGAIRKSAINTAYSYESDGENKTSSQQQAIDFYFDGLIGVGVAAVNGQAVSNAVANNSDILTNRVTVKYKYHSFEALPVISHLSSGQALLVGVDANPQLANMGFETAELNGVSYYKVTTPGIYNNVYVGSSSANGTSGTAYVANSVEVKETDAGLDTTIYWYLNNSSGATATVNFYYNTIADAELANNASTIKFTMINQAYLGDHERYRNYGTASTSGSYLTADKKIVTNATDEITSDHNPALDETDTYSVIHQGESVTYRLSIGTLGGQTQTVSGGDIYDLLPNAPTGMWVKNNNVHVTYVVPEAKPSNYLLEQQLFGNNHRHAVHLCAA